MSAPEIDPIALQVLGGGLRAICDEMGAVLVRAAHSPNIKERRDCSTALFDAAGELVMQAEHIPVHLGSMPEAVAAVAGEDQEPGVTWILNDPFRGGTHLPDITLISPLFADERLIGWSASRAHHADVGGPTPAGMPADSRRLEDEGVVISPRRIDDDGLRGARRADAEPGSATRRPPRPAGRQSPWGQARRRADRAPRARDDSRRDARPSSSTPSAAPGRRSPRSRTAPTGRMTSSRARTGPRSPSASKP